MKTRSEMRGNNEQECNYKTGNRNGTALEKPWDSKMSDRQLLQEMQQLKSFASQPTTEISSVVQGHRQLLLLQYVQNMHTLLRIEMQ